MIENHRLDHTDCVITTEKSAAGFVSHWLCDCGASGTHAGTFDTEPEAMQQAKQAVLIHHQFKHAQQTVKAEAERRTLLGSAGAPPS